MNAARATILVALLVVGLAVPALLLLNQRAVIPSAAGSAPADPADLGNGRADLDEWTGVTWQAAIENPFGDPDPLLRIEGLVDAGDRFIAWGRAPAPGRNQFNDMGAVFVSDDGRSWETIPVDHGVNAASASTIGGVAVGPRGYVAYGSVCCDREAAALWWSADGIGWERQELGGDLNAGEISLADVAAVEDGWVALGQHRNAAAAELWFSEDARSWTSVHRIEGGPQFVPMFDLSHGPGGMFAVGTAIGESGSYDGGVWRSKNGRDWERLAADDPSLAGDEVQLYRVAGYAGGLLATGVAGTAEQRKRCEDLLGMTASLSPPAPPEPGTEGTSCSIGVEQQWVSRDGASWEPTAPAAGGLQPIEFRVVAAGGPGLVLLGEASAPASPDTTLFGSADGSEWSVLDAAEPLAVGVPMGLAVRGDHLIAITEHWDGAATTWRVWLGEAR